MSLGVRQWKQQPEKRHIYIRRQFVGRTRENIPDSKEKGNESTRMEAWEEKWVSDKITLEDFNIGQNLLTMERHKKT